MFDADQCDTLDIMLRDQALHLFQNDASSRRVLIGESTVKLDAAIDTGEKHGVRAFHEYIGVSKDS
jgi:hypothetical protein